jgi:hypothetical protein
MIIPTLYIEQNRLSVTDYPDDGSATELAAVVVFAARSFGCRGFLERHLNASAQR